MHLTSSLSLPRAASASCDLMWPCATGAPAVSRTGVARREASRRHSKQDGPRGAVCFECGGSGGLLPIQAIPLDRARVAVISASNPPMTSRLILVPPVAHSCCPCRPEAAVTEQLQQRARHMAGLRTRVTARSWFRRPIRHARPRRFQTDTQTMSAAQRAFGHCRSPSTSRVQVSVVIRIRNGDRDSNHRRADHGAFQ